jgi:hypothetical protein
MRLKARPLTAYEPLEVPFDGRTRRILVSALLDQRLVPKKWADVFAL